MLYIFRIKLYINKMSVKIFSLDTRISQKHAHMSDPYLSQHLTCNKVAKVKVN